MDSHYLAGEAICGGILTDLTLMLLVNNSHGEWLRKTEALRAKFKYLKFCLLNLS